MRELLARMDSRELAEWMAYASLTDGEAVAQGLAEKARGKLAAREAKRRKR